MSEVSLYEKVLSLGLEAPRPKVRASGGAVLWRHVPGSDGDVEVYWVERSKKLAFMGGFHAFPGGGRSRSDTDLLVLGAPAGIKGASNEAAMPADVLDGIELEPIDARGIMACVLRELFEETGILLARGADSVDSKLFETSRHASLERGANFEAVWAELRDASGRDLQLDAGELVYAGRWLTPPLGPVRFDNRFFLLEWPTDREPQPSVIDGELVAGEWIRPAEAIRRWETGEVVTAPPILHILKVMAEDGPSETGLARLREPFEVNLGPFRRIEFRPGVLMFPLRTPTLPPAAYTNAYILGRSEAVLIDPGSPFPEMIDGMIQAIRDLEKTDGRKVAAIWLTHHHPDHVGGVQRLRAELGVPVAAHAETAKRLSSAGIGVDRDLRDGERVVLEGEPPFPVLISHTPGHAQGHVTFHDEGGGSLLGGDLTAGFGTIVIDPPEGDMDDYLASLERMRDLGAKTLFPAHGPPTIAVKEKLTEYLRHRLWRESKVLEAWNEGLRDTQELLSTVYDDVPEQAHPLAARQLEAHLIRLERLGSIERWKVRESSDAG
ncbi:MAG: MBL fold metallo-hydrolase [bacterium]|nr:MBL fold metallo-hydrolase [bacterium]